MKLSGRELVKEEPTRVYEKGVGSQATSMSYFYTNPGPSSGGGDARTGDAPTRACTWQAGLDGRLSHDRDKEGEDKHMTQRIPLAVPVGERHHHQGPSNSPVTPVH